MPADPASSVAAVQMDAVDAASIAPARSSMAFCAGDFEPFMSDMLTDNVPNAAVAAASYRQMRPSGMIHHHGSPI